MVTILVAVDALRGRVARDHMAREDYTRAWPARCSNLVFELFMDRIALLNEVLAQNPADAFARYGLAMEYAKAGEVERALDEFSRLLAAHPDYTAGYFMAAQTLAKAEREDEARKMLANGIASAKKTGNGHAQSEMESMLAELE